MYQFIVATRSSGACVETENSSWSGASATVRDVSTMSLAGNGTNKWASRAVVALQLAAWSAVGIVLLEKGVTSLQKSPHTTLNVSEITTPISTSNSLYDRVLDNPTTTGSLSRINSLSVIPIDGDESNTARNGPEGDESMKSWREAKNDVITETAERSGTTASVEKSEEIARSREKFPGSGVDVSTIYPRQQFEQTDDKETNDNDEANKNGELSKLNGSKEKNSGTKASTRNKGEVGKDQDTNESERKIEEDKKKEAEDREELPQDTTWSSPVTIKVIMDNLEEHRWESRKRLRVARINAGGGAAAAVAMVAVGAVMLVLGPAVIILRALDERRQERRFLKLSGEEDLPPSYDEATCEFDQAPTYSSLNLDSILATPSSPNSNDSENSHLNPN